MADQNLQSSVETVEPQPTATDRPGRAQTVVTWGLALLTAPAAIIVCFVAIGGVMSIAGCSGDACTAPGSALFGTLFYGAPVVAAVTIIAAFFTARRRWGIAVPLVALALLVADVVVLIVTFQ